MSEDNTQNGAGTTPPIQTIVPPTPPVEDKSKEYEEKLKKLEETNAQLSTIANIVYLDDELRAKFEDKYQRTYGGGKAESNPESKPESKPGASEDKSEEYKVLEEKIGSIESKTRTEVITEFEKKNGITEMTDDERKDLKGKIGAKLTDWGYNIERTPVDRLGTLMEDAFKVVYGEKRMKDTIAKEFQNQNGAFGSFSAGTPPKAEDIELTQGQSYWISKFGLDPEKARKTLSENP